MNKGGKRAGMVVLAVLLMAASFWGGTIYAQSVNSASGGFAAGGAAAAGGRGAGGPFGDLTDDEREQLQGMTDEERQKFMQEKFGDSAAAGPRGGRAGSPSLIGSVVEVAGKAVTLKLESGGSSTVYLTDDTVIAYAEGVAEKDLAADDQVIAVATPATDNVMNATAIVIK